MKRAIEVSIVSMCMLAIGCESEIMGHKIELQCSNGLEVEVKRSDSVELIIITGLKHLKGEFNVVNRTNEIKRFSTSHIDAAINNQNPIRAYKQTFASEAIDFGGVDIQPGHSLNVKVYWPTKLKWRDEIFSFVAKCEDT